MLSEGMHGGIGEKSIEYFQKVYRLFSDRTKQTLRYLPSSAPFPSYKRSDFLGESSLLLETTSLISRGAVAQLLGTTGSLSWNSYSDI